MRDGLSSLFTEGEIDGACAGLHLSLRLPWPLERVTQLRQRCLLAGVRFDTLQEIENGSEMPWRQNNQDAVMFFGFGGLQVQQLRKVLNVLEQEMQALLPH